MKRLYEPREQLGFGFEEMLHEQETAHLPADTEGGIAYYRALLLRHHTAMLLADTATVEALREDAHELALKMNAGDAGILADRDAPGYVLERATAAEPGQVPLWGQTGDFEIVLGSMRVRIDMGGLFGVGSYGGGGWLGFAAHAIEWDQPFLSETGYRSFFTGAALVPGLHPDQFCRRSIEEYLKSECKGKLRSIEPKYREHHKPAAAEAAAEERGAA